MMQNLLEIRGQWRIVGSNDTNKYTYGAGNSSWTKGYVKLCKSKSAGLRWILGNNLHKHHKGFKASPNYDCIEVVYHGKYRLHYKILGETFFLIPDAQDETEVNDLALKSKRTLALQQSSPDADGELLSADDALQQLFTGDDSGEEESTTSLKQESKSHFTKKGSDSPSWLKDHDDWKRRTTQLTPVRKGAISPTPSSEVANTFYNTTSGRSTFGVSRPKALGTISRSSTNSVRSSGSRLSDGASTHSDNTPKPSLTNGIIALKPFRMREPSFSEDIRPSYSKKLMPMPKLTGNSARKELTIELKSGSDDDTLCAQPLLGFTNLGNTCYSNVVLQSLLSLDIFSADLMCCFKEFEANLEDYSLLRCLTELAVAKREQLMTSKDQKNLLKRIFKAVTQKTGRYNDYRQHDAHEFLCEVLDILKEETILQEKKKEGGPSSAGSERREPQSLNPTVNNFEFELLTKLECTACSRVTERSETHNGLTVGIPEVYLHQTGSQPSRKLKLSTYVQDALDCYFQPETIEYLCETCGCKNAVSHQSFNKLPRVLMIVVKRFDNNRYSGGKIERRLGVSRHVTLSSLCQTHVPLAQAPLIPVKLWPIPRVLKSPTENNSTTSSSTKKTSGERLRSTPPEENDVMCIGSSPATKLSARKLALSPRNSDVQEKTVSTLRERSRSPLHYPSLSPDNRPPTSSLFTSVGAPKAARAFQFKSSSSISVKKKLSGSFPLADSGQVNRSKSRSPETKRSRQTRLEEFKFDDEDSELQKAIELSKQECANEKERTRCSGDLFPTAMSEEQQIELARLNSLNDVIGRGAVCEQQSPLKETVKHGQINSPQTLTKAKHFPLSFTRPARSGLRGGCSLGSSSPDTCSPHIVGNTPSRQTRLAGESPYSVTTNDTPPPRILNSPILTAVDEGLFPISKSNNVNRSRRRRIVTPGKSSSNSSTPRKSPSARQPANQQPANQQGHVRNLKLNGLISSDEEELDEEKSGLAVKVARDKPFGKVTFPVQSRSSIKDKSEVKLNSPVKIPVNEDDIFDNDDANWPTPPSSPMVIRTPPSTSSPPLVSFDVRHRSVSPVGSVAPNPPGKNEVQRDFASPPTSDTPMDKSIRASHLLPSQDKENVRPGSADAPCMESPQLKSESNLPELTRTREHWEKLKQHAQTGAEFGFSYKLVGIVSHLGSSSSHGHYVNDAYNICDDAWLSYNDSLVSVSTIQNVCRRACDSGYIYFYMDSIMIADVKNP